LPPTEAGGLMRRIRIVVLLGTIMLLVAAKSLLQTP
jgi:hypothetical protein